MKISSTRSLLRLKLKSIGAEFTVTAETQSNPQAQPLRSVFTSSLSEIFAQL